MQGRAEMEESMTGHRRWSGGKGRDVTGFLVERGACLCCAQKTRDKDGEHMKHVCKNGPVFDSEEVVF